jgi:hypothetical protein
MRKKSIAILQDIFNTKEVKENINSTKIKFNDWEFSDEKLYNTSTIQSRNDEDDEEDTSSLSDTYYEIEGRSVYTMITDTRLFLENDYEKNLYREEVNIEDCVDSFEKIIYEEEEEEKFIIVKNELFEEEIFFLNPIYEEKVNFEEKEIVFINPLFGIENILESISIEFILGEKELEKEFHQFLKYEKKENNLEYLRELEMLYELDEDKVDERMEFIIKEFIYDSKEKSLQLLPEKMKKELIEKFKAAKKQKKEININLLFNPTKSYIIEELKKKYFRKFLETKIEDERYRDNGETYKLDKDKLILKIKKFIKIINIKINFKKEKRVFTGITKINERINAIGYYGFMRRESVNKSRCIGFGAAVHGQLCIQMYIHIDSKIYR